MHEAADSLLQHWREFYLLAGTAASALVALLFVAVSVGAGLLSRERAGATRTYMSPVAFHFTSALVVSLLTLVPSHSRGSLALLIGLNALAGLAYSCFIMWRLFTDDISDAADRLAYGAVPLVSYAAGLVAAWLFYRGSEHAPEVLAGTVLLLLIANIRNAWDLLLSMARHQTELRKRDAASR